MKAIQFVVALTGLFAATSPLSAADAIDPSDASYDWSGFYLGVYAAYGEGTSKSDVAADAHPSDPFWGIHVGYLFDLENVILGVEGDASLSDLDADLSSGVTQDIDNIASLRARIGLPINSTLLFANAGWSWADTEYGYLVLQDQKVVSGPIMGGGAQYAFSDHLIGRLEYNHYFYGTTTYDLETSVDVENSVDEISVGLDFIFH